MSAAARAYDATAARYDALLAAAPRARVHAAYTRVARAGDTVVDAGCGTGLDAAFLAGLGVNVVGVDASEGMLAVARARGYPSGASVRFVHGDIQQLGRHVASPVSGIVSAFAALNTVADLSDFSREARSLLVPGGFLVLHFLTPGGLYDRVGDFSRGRLNAAVSGLDERERDVRVGDSLVSHRFIRPDLLVGRHFADRFTLEGIEQTGALAPADAPTRLPSPLARALARADSTLGTAPGLRLFGRFALVVLRAR